MTNFPKVIVDQFEENGEKDHLAHYIFLRFHETKDTFNCGFNSGIGRLLSCDFHTIALTSGGYLSDNDYFFLNKKNAIKCAKIIRCIIRDIFSDQEKIDRFIKMFIQLVTDEANTMGKRFPNDKIRMINSIPEYIEGMVTK